MSYDTVATSLSLSRNSLIWLLPGEEVELTKWPVGASAEALPAAEWRHLSAVRRTCLKWPGPARVQAHRRASGCPCQSKKEEREKLEIERDRLATSWMGWGRSILLPVACRIPWHSPRRPHLYHIASISLSLYPILMSSSLSLSPSL